MSKIKITAENNIQFEAEGEDYFVQEERRAFMEMLADKNTVKAVKAVQEAITPRTVRPDGLAEETVVIYDDYGIPSIMRKISKVTDAELFGGANKTHPAFIIDGEEYDEIYISVYPNCVINGRPYSLPYMKPWTDLTNDEAAKACFSKGDGWQPLAAPNGKQINFSIGDDFKFTTDEPEDGYNGTEWENVYSDFGFSDELKELALYPGEDNAYLYVDSTEGEYLPYRGGYWGNGTRAGVFCTSFV